MNQKNKTPVVIILLSGILLFSLFNLSAQEVSYCCEKTKAGAWCQNAPQSECDDSSRSTPTSCEATSFCKLGCCYDSQEGTCMRNTPQIVCQDSNGAWSGDSALCEIPQCQLGCCLIGDQAAFVTQVKCKKLSALYGLETNYRTDITSEAECIASATSDVKGACVFEKDFEKTCRFTTQRECAVMRDSGSLKNTSIEFFENKLCSDEKLGTNCGPSQKTACVEGKDEVYFADTCGNIGNIYDASKINDKAYWSDVYSKAESCGVLDANGNANSASCGNCDYFLGSICKQYKRGTDTKPTYGNNICRNLGCNYNGKEYRHGETWCAEAKGTSKIFVGKEESDVSSENLPGSRYFRFVCYNNEISIEPCEDRRGEICIGSNVGVTGRSFRTASCIVNKWQDCVGIAPASSNPTDIEKAKQECENADKRDCKWIETDNGQTRKCVPKYPPGFDFWSSESESGSLCTTASVTCNVKLEKKFGEAKWRVVPDKTCVEAKKKEKGCGIVVEVAGQKIGDETAKKCVEEAEKECTADCVDENGNIKESWKNENNNICTSLGDCGAKVNYIGVNGYFNFEKMFKEG